MYTIELTTKTRGKPLVLSYSTRESAMQSWDDFVDGAEPGDKMTLKHPKGSTLSEYTMVDRSDYE